MENSRFRLFFLDCYFLMSNKEYRTDVKHRPKGSNLFTEGTRGVVAIATVTFQDGVYFGFKAI